MAETLVAVFGSARARPGDGLWEDAVACGRLLTEAGFGVVTGGYGGTMEAVSQGAADAGGRVVGVTAGAVFPDRPGANRHVAEERSAASITERIHMLVSGTAGSISLPGAIGTFTELVSAWNAAYVAQFSGAPAKPVIAVGPKWGDIVRMLAPQLEAQDLVTTVDSVPAAVAAVVARLRPTAD